MPSRDTPEDSKASERQQDTSFLSQSREQQKGLSSASETKADAEGKPQPQNEDKKVGREHPSNHEWISDTAQKILLEDEPAERDRGNTSGTQQAEAGNEGDAESATAQHGKSSQPVNGSVARAEEGSIDPEVLASLPPEIQRELKLASMMKLGTVKKPQQQQQQQQLHPRPVSKPQTTVAKQKKKGPNIGNYFSAK